MSNDPITDLVAMVSASIGVITDAMADAWDVGYKAGLEDMSAVRDGDMTIHGLADNPYRTEDAS